MKASYPAWILRCRDDEHAASEGARIVLDSFVQAGESRFGLALSGGRGAPTLFRELVRQAALRRSPLREADFFWADERCVRPDDPESNFGIARAALLERLGVPAERIHRLQGELPPHRAAERANADWADWIARRGDHASHLDCVVLGAGEDGHVASLFIGNLPGDLADREAFRAVVGPKPPPQRVTMGYPLLWSARRVVVVAPGPGKRAMVEDSLAGRVDTPLARVVQGRAGRETIVVLAPR